MSSNFYYVKVTVSGDVKAREKFKADHLLEFSFDLNSILPMPQELDMDFDNLVETGYEALYGEWEKVAKYWMFKEPAEKLGYSFPLESRDHVINCLKSFDCADSYLVSGQRFKENLEKFGHGTRVTWREANWGTGGNAEGIKVLEDGCALVLWFVSDAYPSKAMKKLSGDYPKLDFMVFYVDEYKRNGRSFLLKNGKEVEKQKILPTEISKTILEYEASPRSLG